MMKGKAIKLALAGALVAMGTTAQATAITTTVIDFDDNVLAPDSAYLPTSSGTWSSQGATFDYEYNFSCCWGNFTYSNQTDTTTAWYMNDLIANTGQGVSSGQHNYAVANTGFGDATLSIAGARVVDGGFCTNTSSTVWKRCRESRR